MHIRYQVDILRDVFRKGLAHDYFARGGVSRDGEHPPLFFDDKIGVVLDAETLVNDFLESLDRFKEELSEDNYKLRMTEAEEKIQGILETHKALINDLPKRVITTLNTSTTVSRTKVPTSVTPPPPHSY